jgi:hypothetical protein
MKTRIIMALIALLILQSVAPSFANIKPPSTLPPMPASPPAGKIAVTQGPQCTFFVSTNSYKVWVNATDARDEGYWLLRGTQWIWYPMNSVNFEFQVSWNTGSEQVGFYNYLGYNWNNSWPIHYRLLMNASTEVVLQTRIGNPYIILHSLKGPQRIEFSFTETWVYYPTYYLVNREYYLPNNGSLPTKSWTNSVSAIEGSGNNPAWFGYDLGQDNQYDYAAGVLPSGQIQTVTETGSGETHLQKSSINVKGNLPYMVTLFSENPTATETVSEILLNYTWHTPTEKVDWTITQNSYDRAELSVPWMAWGYGYVKPYLNNYFGYCYAMFYGQDGGTTARNAIQDALQIERTMA